MGGGEISTIWWASVNKYDDLTESTVKKNNEDMFLSKFLKCNLPWFLKAHYSVIFTLNSENTRRAAVMLTKMECKVYCLQPILSLQEYPTFLTYVHLSVVIASTASLIKRLYKALISMCIIN